MSYTLITGVTSGIGRALANEFAANSHDLILVGRDLSRLETVKSELLHAYRNCTIQLVEQDLSQLDAGEKIYTEILSRGLQVQYLVNNAGIGFVGKFESIPYKKEENMMITNMISVSSLCKYFIPMLKEQPGHAGILNVASNGAFHPGPYTANYYATKAYVLHLSKAIRLELAPDHVWVSSLCPGATESDFCRKAGKAQISGSMSASKLARIGYRGFMRKRNVIIPGIGNHLVMLCPQAIRSRIVGISQRRLRQNS